MTYIFFNNNNLSIKLGENVEIARVEVIPLGCKVKIPPSYLSYAIIKITTDDGVIGYGESSDCWGHWTPLVIKAIVDEELSRFILGESPLSVERLTLKMRGHVARRVGFQGAVMQAISGIEIALWDILGKVRNQPIYKILGEHRDKIPLYAAGPKSFPNSPEWHASFFKPYLDSGFEAIKIRVGGSKSWDVDVMKGLRKLLGEDIKLIADAASNYTLPTALKMLREFEKYNLYWLEEPVPEYYGADVISKLVHYSSVPIAYGEHTFGISGFKDLILHGAVDVIEPDATICGGISEARKICMFADAFGLPASPHCGSLTAIGLAANLHLSASIPNLDYLEYSTTIEEYSLRDAILEEPIFSLKDVKNGCLEVPKEPGLGICGEP